MVRRDSNLPSRVQVGLWTLMAAAVVLLTVRGYDSVPIGYYRDDADYILLARSLFHAPSYGLQVYGPSQPGESFFPFGYPLLLAPFQEIPALALDGPKLLSLLATLVNAALLFWGWPLLTRNRSYWWALAVTSLHSLSPQVIGQAHEVLSEPIFTTLVLLTLLVTERIAGGASGLRLAVALGILLAGVVATRTIGFAVLAVAVVYILATRRAQAIRQLLTAGVFMCAVVLLMAATTSADVRDLIPRQYANNGVVQVGGAAATSSERPEPSWSDYALVRLRWVILPIGGERLAQRAAELGLPGVSEAMGLTVTVFCVAGYLIWVRRYGWSAYALFVAVYFVGIVLWPWSGRRYLYIVQPALFFSFLLAAVGLAHAFLALRRPAPSLLAGEGWDGGEIRSNEAPPLPPEGRGLLPSSIGRGLAPRVHAALGTAVVVALLLLGIYASYREGGSRIRTADLQERASWLVSLASPPGAVMTEEPVIDHIYTNRPTVGYDPAEYPEGLLYYLETREVSYVLVAPRIRWQGTDPQGYSRRTNELRAALDDLAAQGQVVPAVASPDGSIRGYRVVR